MNFVFLVGPGRTGGPEAIHQLADALVSLGYHAYIHYVEEELGEFRPLREVNNQYPEYEGVRLIHDYRHLSEVVLVLPELWAHLALELARHHMTLVWWLSVDNGLSSLGRIGFYIDHYRSHPGILNAYQSGYAKNFLESLGLNIYNLSLSDYTCGSSSTRGFRRRITRESITICHNPLKGEWLARLFKLHNHCVQLLPINGMSPVQVREALADADAYVDFGQLPGKDRMPREALLVGTRVFIRRNGDGAFESDWLLPATSYFSVSDCISGALMQAIQTDLLIDSPLWEQARKKVLCEKEVFLDECKHMATVCSQLMGQLKANPVVKEKIDNLARYPDPLSIAEKKRTRAEEKLTSISNSTIWKMLRPLRRALARVRRLDPSWME